MTTRPMIEIVSSLSVGLAARRTVTSIVSSALRCWHPSSFMPPMERSVRTAL